MQVYFDNSSTTAVCKSAADKAYEMMVSRYGNPSSLHSFGMEAEGEIESARSEIEKSLGVSQREIIFTSGGTEANNLAVLGAAQCRKRMGNRVVISAVEHSSVLEACKELERRGFELICIDPDESGSVKAEDLESAIDEKTVLVSLMAVNNETGAVQPFDKVSRIIKRKKAPAVFHCDGVQAYGKIRLNPEKLGIDLLSVSAHKLHGPKGVGALYIKKGVRITPQHFGGEQQNKLRPGTEPAPLIAAFGAAVKEMDYSAAEAVTRIRDYIKSRILQLERVYLNSPDDALPYILNFSVEGIRSETLLHYLAEREIYVSSGSACAKGKPSHVLTAMGLSRARADSAIRASFSKYSTLEQAEVFCEAVAQATKELVRR